MKKLFVLLVAVVFISCSEDQLEPINPSAETSLSVLDGKMLSFKDDKSFIKEYSQLSELKSRKEIKTWISKKGHSSRLNILDALGGIQDSIIDNTRIIYSDALKAIVNDESKLKINGKVLWLNGNNFYELLVKDYDKNTQELKSITSELEVYGNISNGFNAKSANSKSNSTNKLAIPAVNGTSVTYINDGPNSKKYILIIFNETINLNGSFSSKMYLKSVMQYKSCSFWRCTWKEDTTTQRTLNVNVVFDPGWSAQYINTTYVIGTQTLLLSTLEFYGPIGTTFYISGNITTRGFAGYNWIQTF